MTTLTDDRCCFFGGQEGVDHEGVYSSDLGYENNGDLSAAVSRAASAFPTSGLCILFP